MITITTFSKEKYETENNIKFKHFMKCIIDLIRKTSKDWKILRKSNGILLNREEFKISRDV